MLKDYYQRELANLRELGVEFSRDNPALAPMLGAKGDDPDVERLLEAVAFMAALTRRRLDEGFPDFIQSLLRVVFPQVLLPTPSATLMHFRPVQGFNEAARLPKGAQVASIEVGGARAVFSTSADLRIVPAAVTKVQVAEDGSGQTTAALTVSSAAPVGSWLGSSIKIHLAGDYAEASDRRSLLLGRLVSVEAEVKGRTVRLGRRDISPAGFDAPLRILDGTPLLAFELVRDYFVMPQKFMFIEISGLGALAGAEDPTLTLRFNLGRLKTAPPPMRPEHFLLNVCPALNVFPHPAQPITIDHKSDQYLLRPQDFDSARLDIYSVTKVASLDSSGGPRYWAPFERFSARSPDAPVYSLSRRSSPVSGRPEHHLSVVYPKGSPPPAKETVTVDLLCHNEGLTEYLRSGEIREPTDTSPAMASFANLIPPTRHCPPPEGDQRLWSLLSHLHVNHAALLSAETLAEMLNLHSVPDDPDQARRLGNQRRVEAIETVSSRLETFFLKGRPVSGSRVELTVDPAGFASSGDLHLFGDVLDHFLGAFHHINTYSRLSVIGSRSREVITWPPRLGPKRLL